MVAQRQVEKAIRYVDGIIRETIGSRLKQDEKTYLLGSPKWLRDESINQAGKPLVNKTLDSQSYADIVRDYSGSMAGK